MTEKYFDLNGSSEILSGMFYISGDFGIIDGKNVCLKSNKDNTYIFESCGLEMTSEFEEFENGVILRRDKIKNISDKKVVVNSLKNRFKLEGNDYEVYTQFNGWLYESDGNWQPLKTAVSAKANGMRMCDGAAPVMALYNKQTKITTVFQLMSECSWEMTAERRTWWGNISETVVETGFNSDSLLMDIAPGEEIELPAVFLYETHDKEGLGSYKLHKVFNELYPRKKLPVMYNTWLMDFDNINADNILRQVKTAAELGIEIFTIDAGWFGNGEDWGNQVGEWSENTTSAICGRLGEVSSAVRELGMTFGMWLEPERALKGTTVNTNHPDWFFEGEFLDFTNNAAFDYIFNLTCSLIEKYHLGFMKFDFNSTTTRDPKNSAFYHYIKAKHRYVSALKEKYPYLYICNCASGGMRMDLGHAAFYDSYWISDNQGPYEGIDIYLGSIKRLPPCVIEKWDVQTFLQDVPEYSKKEHRSLPISCNNGTWDFVINVSEEYTKNFLSGGPFGFSCDISAFPEDYKKEMTEFIAEYKKDREFYISACAKILCDTDSFKCIEYFDNDLSKIEIKLFTKLIYQPTITVYPKVDESAKYIVDGEEILGKDILKDGLEFGNLKLNDCQTITLKKA